MRGQGGAVLRVRTAYVQQAYSFRTTYVRCTLIPRIGVSPGSHFLIFGQEIFVVVDTCKCFWYTQIVGYHTGSHIYAFVWSNGNKQVCSAYAALFEVVYGGRVASTVPPFSFHEELELIADPSLFVHYAELAFNAGLLDR